APERVYFDENGGFDPRSAPFSISDGNMHLPGSFFRNGEYVYNKGYKFTPGIQAHILANAGAQVGGDGFDKDANGKQLDTDHYGQFVLVTNPGQWLTLNGNTNRFVLTDEKGENAVSGGFKFAYYSEDPSIRRAIDENGNEFRYSTKGVDGRTSLAFSQGGNVHLLGQGSVEYKVHETDASQRQSNDKKTPQIASLEEPRSFTDVRVSENYLTDGFSVVGTGDQIHTGTIDRLLGDMNLVSTATMSGSKWTIDGITTVPNGIETAILDPTKPVKYTSNENGNMVTKITNSEEATINFTSNGITFDRPIHAVFYDATRKRESDVNKGIDQEARFSLQNVDLKPIANAAPEQLKFRFSADDEANHLVPVSKMGDYVDPSLAKARNIGTNVSNTILTSAGIPESTFTSEIGHFTQATMKGGTKDGIMTLTMSDGGFGEGGFLTPDDSFIRHTTAAPPAGPYSLEHLDALKKEALAKAQPAPAPYTGPSSREYVEDSGVPSVLRLSVSGGQIPSYLKGTPMSIDFSADTLEPFLTTQNSTAFVAPHTDLNVGEHILGSTAKAPIDAPMVLANYQNKDLTVHTTDFFGMVNYTANGPTFAGPRMTLTANDSIHTWTGESNGGANSVVTRVDVESRNAEAVVFKGDVLRSDLTSIESIKGSILDPNHPNTVWETTSENGVRLKPGIKISEEQVKKIVGDYFASVAPNTSEEDLKPFKSNEYDQIIPVLQQPQGGGAQDGWKVQWTKPFESTGTITNFNIDPVTGKQIHETYQLEVGGSPYEVVSTSNVIGGGFA
ncbi:MAG: hypothetical protein WCH62_08160, partial [Candidatus Omnitrophota bacterium]